MHFLPEIATQPLHFQPPPQEPSKGRLGLAKCVARGACVSRVGEATSPGLGILWASAPFRSAFASTLRRPEGASSRSPTSAGKDGYTLCVTNLTSMWAHQHDVLSLPADVIFVAETSVKRVQETVTHLAQATYHRRSFWSQSLCLLRACPIFGLATARSAFSITTLL